MIRQLPRLYFKKTHKSTGESFEDYFTYKNCKDWPMTPFSEFRLKAHKRIAYWNANVPDWHYEFVGWRLPNKEENE